jgi:hypothetical protein
MHHQGSGRISALTWWSLGISACIFLVVIAAVVIVPERLQGLSDLFNFDNMPPVSKLSSEPSQITFCSTVPDLDSTKMSAIFWVLAVQSAPDPATRLEFIDLYNQVRAKNATQLTVFAARMKAAQICPT